MALSMYYNNWYNVKENRQLFHLIVLSKSKSFIRHGTGCELLVIYQPYSTSHFTTKLQS